MAFHLGTSGYAYDEWKGVFYPDDLKKKDQLRYFASRFDSVEINYTFRRHPSEKTLDGWVEQTPEGFLFTMKAHQRITHWKRLVDVSEDVAFLLERVRRLGGRLGVILFQCPPTLAFDRDRAEAFLDTLPDGGRYAMEFRHPSWEDARPLLLERGVAWCTAETDDHATPTDSFEPFCYLRLRKERYADDELRAWAARAQIGIDGGHDVYCYFKHEEKGIGPRYAERMAELLGRPDGESVASSAS